MPSNICKFFLTWWLIQQVTGLTGPLMLDMAPKAFDDQYEGCVNKMEEKAPLLLQEDFNMNAKLKVAWEEAKKRWNNIKPSRTYPKGFNDFHGTALVAYTGSIAVDFNRAVREFKENPGQFHYKAFHYYLTRALQLLSNGDCHSVYRGTKTRFHYTGAGSVRFGQFTSSSLSKAVAQSPEFFSDHGTLFIIKTCLGVNIKQFSFRPDQEEVLIPGYEVYQKVRTQGYNEIFLDSPKRKKSNYNCLYSSAGARESCVSLFLVVLPSLLVQLLCLAEP
ncbi:T-cell ecto-ADP-ribosyltransferase 2 [Rattus rattus]|uniref:T-cell ecto-ADP-ribosyltransferase 2 n=1 Tax=Rattus rattus TaxID=10117 RepID=UPI0013F30C3A|nr:T-cell ecto-ADP-ribosyltransferase 2 [Rattus rattus]